MGWDEVREGRKTEGERKWVGKGELKGGREREGERVGREERERKINGPLIIQNTVAPLCVKGPLCRNGYQPVYTVLSCHVLYHFMHVPPPPTDRRYLFMQLPYTFLLYYLVVTLRLLYYCWLLLRENVRGGPEKLVAIEFFVTAALNIGQFFLKFFHGHTQ